MPPAAISSRCFTPVRRITPAAAAEAARALRSDPYVERLADTCSRGPVARRRRTLEPRCACRVVGCDCAPHRVWRARMDRRRRSLMEGEARKGRYASATQLSSLNASLLDWTGRWRPLARLRCRGFVRRGIRQPRRSPAFREIRVRGGAADRSGIAVRRVAGLANNVCTAGSQVCLN